jgi:hypothetical protein
VPDNGTVIVTGTPPPSRTPVMMIVEHLTVH